MSEPDYITVAWRDDGKSAQCLLYAGPAIAKLLADGWQLHGGPIALPGERVLQALVKPAEGESKEYLDGWHAGYNEAAASLSGEDAKP